MYRFIIAMKQYKFVIDRAQVVNVIHFRKIYGLQMGPIPRIKHQKSTLAATITDQHVVISVKRVSVKDVKMTYSPE